MTEALIPIWERVLQQSPIGPDDNFFDLGGDSLSAVTLFLEVEKLCGRQLPPVMIYNTPTIAALAAELEQPSIPRLPPLVLLRKGSAEPPVFIAHGLGGSVIDFYRLLTHIRCDRNVYGMQARGIDGVDEPFATIEEMAQYHLDAIRAVQPHGPYLFVGYSLGGLVCMEIAQRLTRRWGARRAVDRAGCLSEPQPAFSLAAFPALQPAGMAKSGFRDRHVRARRGIGDAGTIARSNVRGTQRRENVASCRRGRSNDACNAPRSGNGPRSDPELPAALLSRKSKVREGRGAHRFSGKRGRSLVRPG